MQNLRPASKKYTLTSNEISKQIATSEGVIVMGVIVTGGSGSAVVRVFDSRNGSVDAGPGPNNYKLAANAGESTVSSIQHVMTQGLYIELEDGAGFNGEATIFYD